MKIDDIARNAANEVHGHVGVTVDAPAALRELGIDTPRRWSPGRWLAVAAALVLFAGGFAVLTAHRRSGNTTVTFIPTAPRIGRAADHPDDGIQSQMLPVTADPVTGLVDNETVTLRGSGFVAGELVAVVQCVASDVAARSGIDSCDIAQITYGNADASGAVVVQAPAHRIITTPKEGTVDCAIAAQRCSFGMGSTSDYDRSGGIKVDFDPNAPVPDQATIALSPSSGLHDGDMATVTGAGLAAGPVMVYECLASTTGVRSSCLAMTTDATAGADGHLVGTVNVKVHRLLGDGGSYPTDCAGYPGACVVVAEAAGQATSRPVALNFLKEGAPPVPTITLQPDSPLHDGELVQLEGQTFSPGVAVTTSECGYTADGGGAVCISFAPVVVRGDGTFAASFAIARVLGEGSGAVDCARPASGCTLEAAPAKDGGFAADRLELSFEPG